MGSETGISWKENERWALSVPEETLGWKELLLHKHLWEWVRHKNLTQAGSALKKIPQCFSQIFPFL